MRAIRARIEADVDLTGARITNRTGPALAADGLAVGAGLELSHAVLAGAGSDGTLRLLSAHVAGQLNLIDARVSNKSGPAVVADRLAVDGNLFLADTTLAGTGEGGAVRLCNSRIGGQVSMVNAELSNGSGPAVSGPGLRVAGDLLLDGMTDTVGPPSDAVPHTDDHPLWLDLADAQVEGTLVLTAGHLSAHPSGRRWLVDGLRLGAWPRQPDQTLVPTPALLEFLQYGTQAYAAQPYQQLAAFAAAAGDEADQRRILTTQHRDRIRRGSLSRKAKAWEQFTGVALGYGYHPARMAWLLVATVLVALAATFTLSDRGATILPPPANTVGATTAAAGAHPCTPTQQAGYALDAALPLVTTTLTGACTAAPTSAGITLTWILAILQLLAWAAATLFVAGYTRIVRRA